ncbi:MAG: esterase family protein [Treponema sp.]|jgi:S-formylglutathione hydrolase FrmB|nr:esterase family protein [Treponema sp.]
MALMEVDFFSRILGLNCQANVIIPQINSGVGVKSGVKKNAYPVLWLLHGASDDHTIWLRRTSIERYVTSLGLAVVMPQAHLSSYVNMVHGPKYFDFFTQELPQIMGDFFPVSPRREDNYVAGLSMGGNGALTLGIGRPDLYSAVGCFSAGNLNISPSPAPAASGQRKSGKASRTISVYGVENRGDVIGNPDFDIFVKAEGAIKSGQPLPRIFHCCGTDDFLYANALTTAEWFKNHPQFAYEFHDGPGAHTWEFWDEWVQTFLKWLLPETK